MSRPLATIVFILAVLLVPFAAGAAEKPPGRTVEVTGVGHAAARPDTGAISMGVVSEGKTARDALDKNSAAMSRVIVELKSHKVDPKDIQTTSFAVHPKFQHFQDGKPPAIVGYRVVNSVRVMVRDLKQLGAILDQAVSSGSNQINGIAFSLAEPEAIEDKSRTEAMEDALHKAELYATAGKTKLGKVISIREEAVASPPVPVFRRVAAEAKGAQVPVEPGEHRVQTRVNVTWELKD